ncbi:hypothetical protein D0Y65_052505 [Glycine soja]|uniref:Alpha-(1,6)-fucosyltransferase n=1 Tax=Glycine soja TaxID=3848 RepID=A0A445FL79_GLYSO|nr:hypothetical protein D0Y65_052505 [Glycine soja]
MEALNQRSIERVVSHRALQMGTSFPCQICVVGFLCGVCLASFILAALTSFGNLQLDRFHSQPRQTDSNFKPKERERLTDLKSREERESLLYSAWSCVLSKSESEGNECLLKLGISRSSLPKAPHLENSKVKTQLYDRLDKHTGNHSFPPWTSWKGLLDTHPAAATTEQIKISRRQAVFEGAYPPWDQLQDKLSQVTTRCIEIWGEPWKYLQPTTDINGSLVASHRKMDRRWWRAQAVRYLMRFPTEYTCNLLNEARHAAFGKIAAEMVLESPAEEWPKENSNKAGSDIEEYVLSNHKPWIPSPLLSMHVRMGDKACEMKVVEFEEYMQLAAARSGGISQTLIAYGCPQRCRYCDCVGFFSFSYSSNLLINLISGSHRQNQRIFWLELSHYTKVRRQGRTNVSMAKYEASLGRESSTNYPLVNFMMAADSDFLVGALGSTWCFLIDRMRNTGGKVMAGYLSVNKDGFW